MKTYEVKLKRDPEGWWVALVRGVPGCHTQGRTIRQTEERVREALGLFVEDAAKAKLKLLLPARLLKVVSSQQTARARAAKEQERAQEALQRAVQKLTQDLRLSVRDAGELLGLSHQRVQQLREASRARA